MKKIIPILVVGVLVLSGLGAVAVTEKEKSENNVSLKTESILVSEPIAMERIAEGETYIELNMEGTNARLYRAGEPILPIYTKTMSFPFGTKIVDITYETKETKSMVLSDKIIPAPQPVLQGMDTEISEHKINEAIYTSDSLFPDNWFSYSIGGGLDENSEHKTFLTIRAYPIRYSSATDTIYYVEELELTITYEEPETSPFPATSAYDMVIIAPSTFSGGLQELISHKNDHGVNTTLKKTEEIYDEYPGVDKPEQIKYFIKDAIETDGIKYVLLVGGLKSYIFGDPKDDVNQGSKSWHVPVRYTNLYDTGGQYDPGFISDLYYADIYKWNNDTQEWEFDDWDSNGNGVFAEWKGFNKDVIDLYPDVYIGRLACRNTFEVKIMVDKIIDYETSVAGSSWYDKMVVVAGDSHDDAGTNYLEGELVSEKILDEYMDEFTPVKIFASNEGSDPSMTPETKNIRREISAGCGHLFFDGHASPFSWTTHYPRDFDNWAGGIDSFNFPMLFNGDKLPVACVVGCHNSQFNVTILSAMGDKDNSKHMWCYGLPIPECWSWWLTRKIGGGSIATIGCSGLGYGTVGEHGDLDGDGVNEPDCVEALTGYWFIQFYKTFDEGEDILGETWGGAINKYLDIFPGMDYQTDAKTVEQLPLLGDPSLKIGGY